MTKGCWRGDGWLLGSHHSPSSERDGAPPSVSGRDQGVSCTLSTSDRAELRQLFLADLGVGGCFACTPGEEIDSMEVFFREPPVV